MADLRTELLTIREQHGRLTPAIVVEAAQAEDHPLHSRFEWDDAVAGHKYRLQQAKQLIRVVRETYIDKKGNPEDVRFFHAIPREEGMVYEPLPEIVGDDLATKVLLASMEREWRSLRKRYEKFSEFRAMVLTDLSAGEAA
jgi:hypothetical protein